MSYEAILPGLLGLLPATKAVTDIWLAGDSTMAEGGGRSARSYRRDGRFDIIIADEVVAGDWVTIELGHNDNGSLTPTGNGWTDCPGQAAQICYSEYNGVNETVYTFAATLEWASAMYLAKGAKVTLSSQTPDNTWETGTYTYAPNRFEYYAWYVASVLGGPSKRTYFR